MRRTVMLSIALLALAAAPAAAQLASTYLDWAAGPAQHLFTKQDREEWRAIATDEAAEAFIRLFWARRDPTPESAENEFRREFERRVVYADQQFGEEVDGGRRVPLLVFAGTNDALAEEACGLVGRLSGRTAVYTGQYGDPKTCFDGGSHRASVDVP